jgi:hypothetical protein
MTGGLIALAVAVAAAIMLGGALRRRSGRFRAENRSAVSVASSGSSQAGWLTGAGFRCP